MSESAPFNLKITNYKSIDKLELDGIGPFTVFAGPNGSGKSNLFDALDFFGRVIRVDVEDALRAHGGAENIRSAKRYAKHNRRLRFAMDWTLPAFEPPPEVARYDLSLHSFAVSRANMDSPLLKLRSIHAAPVHSTL